MIVMRKEHGIRQQTVFFAIIPFILNKQNVVWWFLLNKMDKKDFFGLNIIFLIFLHIFISQNLFCFGILTFKNSDVSVTWSGFSDLDHGKSYIPYGPCLDHR